MKGSLGRENEDRGSASQQVALIFQREEKGRLPSYLVDLWPGGIGPATHEFGPVLGSPIDRFMSVMYFRTYNIDILIGTSYQILRILTGYKAHTYACSTIQSFSGHSILTTSLNLSKTDANERSFVNERSAAFSTSGCTLTRSRALTVLTTLHPLFFNTFSDGSSSKIKCVYGDPAFVSSSTKRPSVLSYFH